MRRSRDRVGECSCEQSVEEFARSAQLFNPSEWVHYIASTERYAKRRCAICGTNPLVG